MPPVLSESTPQAALERSIEDLSKQIAKCNERYLELQELESTKILKFTPLQRLQLKQKMMLGVLLKEQWVKKVWRLYEELWTITAATSKPPRPRFNVRETAPETNKEQEKERQLTKIRDIMNAINKNKQQLQRVEEEVATIEKRQREKTKDINEMKDENSKYYLYWRKCSAKLTHPSYPGEEKGQSRKIRQAYLRIKRNDTEVKELEESINTDNKMKEQKKKIAEKIRANTTELVQRQSSLTREYNALNLK